MRILAWLLISCGTVLAMTSDGGKDGGEDDLWDREDLYDRTTKKLKPVRQVVEDHTVKDFPRIRDCGPDETQNWYEPDPEDCSCYFVCTGRFYVHRKCSAGLYYDVKTNDCNWPELVECLDRPTPWVAPQYLGPHYVHEHYNIFEYTNTKTLPDKRKNQTEAGKIIDRWGEAIADEDGDSVPYYEYFM